MARKISSASNVIFPMSWVGYSYQQTPPQDWPIKWLSNPDELSQFPAYLMHSQDDLMLFVNNKPYFSARDCYSTVLTGQHQFILNAIRRADRLPEFVIDGTAGWGREALTMALAGIHVHAIERADLPTIFFKYACQQIFIHLKNIQIFHLDFAKYLQEKRKTEIEMIYCDPLFFDSKKTLSKKAMQILYIENEKMFGAQEDNSIRELLLSQRGVRSLVIKQPKNSPRLFLNDCVVIERVQKTCRYDLYCLNGASIY